MEMLKLKLMAFAAAATCGASLIAAPASAITFAQASQINTNESTFFHSNTGTGTTTISGSGEVRFIVTDDDGLLNLPPTGPFDFQVADFTFTGTSTNLAVGAGLTAQQLIDSGTLTFTNSLGNLLTVNFTNGLLGGRDGGVFLWGGDDSSIGASVTYTSDFESPDFSTLIDGTDNFMIGLTLNPSSSNLAVGAGGQLASFQASAVGTFRTGVIPEPTTWGMMILGFAGMGVALRSHRRREPGALVA